MSKWLYICACRKGTAHEQEGTPCQDAVIIREDSNCIVAALADGVGSLPLSHIAADLVTSGIVEWFQRNALRLKRADKKSQEELVILRELVPALQNRVRQYARQHRLGENEMDCNLAFVSIIKTGGPEDLVYTGRLGDCAVCLIGDQMTAETSKTIVGSVTDTIMDRRADTQIRMSRGLAISHRIYGFILTSDGLENEIYMKGSSLVMKSAEGYYNILHTPMAQIMPDDPMAQQILDDRLKELGDTGYFTDDMSIAVISRDTKPRIFPEDPRWLCICGHHNRLTNSYCESCGADFVKLYRNVDMSSAGDKGVFFRELNRDPDREKALIGIAPSQAPAAEVEPDIIWRPQTTDAGPTDQSTELAVGSEERSVSQQFDPSVHMRSDPPSSAADLTKNPKEPQEKTEQPATDAPETAPDTNTPDSRENHRVPDCDRHAPGPRSLLTNFLVFFCILLGVCNLVFTCLVYARIDDLCPQAGTPTVSTGGDAEQQTASEGLLLESGMVYYGPTRNGKPHGYGVVYDGDQAQFAVFADGELITSADADAQGTVSADQITLSKDLSLREAPSYSSVRTVQLKEGDRVLPTGQEQDADGVRWAEVITADGTVGWCNMDDLYKTEP